jgi:hypothetical protein
MRHIHPRKGPVVAHFTRGTNRRSVRYKQREQDDAKGGHALPREEGLLVKRFGPHSKV